MTALLVQALGHGRIDGAYDKCFVRASDPSFPLRLLPPYTAATDAECAQFLGAVRTQLPHWLPG